MGYNIMPVSSELYHHGILGQKWGVRRYQNADGSLTNAGRRKYGTKSNFNKVQRAKAAANTEKELQKIQSKSSKSSSAATTGKKTKQEMTDEELAKAIQRKRMEREYDQLTPQKEATFAQRFIKSAVYDVAGPVARDAAKNIGKKYVEQKLIKQLGLDKKSEKEILQNKYDVLKLKNDIDALKNPDTAKKEKEKLQSEYDRLKLKKDIDSIKNPDKDKAEKEAMQKEYDKLKLQKDLDAIKNPDDELTKLKRRADMATTQNRAEMAEEAIKKRASGSNDDTSDDTESGGNRAPTSSSSSDSSDGTYSWSRYGSDYDRSSQYSYKQAKEGTVESTKKAGSNLLNGDTKKTVVDAEYWEVNDAPKKSGQNYVNSVLGLPSGQSNSSSSSGGSGSNGPSSGDGGSSKAKRSSIFNRSKKSAKSSDDLNDYTNDLLKSNASKMRTYQQVQKYKSDHPNTSMSDAEIERMLKNQ